MFELVTILIDIILPIFMVMAIGFLMQKKFNMNLKTLAKLNIYFVVPGFIFVTLYESQFSGQLFVNILFFFVLFVVALYVLSTAFAKLLKLTKGKKTTFTNSAIFFNSGNYGVPVNDLVFKSDPYAMSIQVIVLTLQNIFLFSYGVFSLRSVDQGKLSAALGYFKMPVLYAMMTGVILNVYGISIPTFIWEPATYIADAMIAIALLTLGAQVAQIKFISGMFSVYFSLFIRLIVGPIIALGMIVSFGIEGVTAQALLIASAMPTSVNSAVIAQEYDNHPQFAAQIVLYSTFVSAITVTLVIYLARHLF
ncbi:AEC family transporter [Desertibacillus haloalkaliphilus]|uniref:AEC family transporter n=1 Tax=Desertibacillus haloalkaliphilus TaxID=1328930 RepID=UPI001C271096|nr:AEC family transporter [Desertibacillus haloalkaliphilus]MBU8906345.1 AEC family transporter [Desertibacillus haloalkaliphilus]